MSARAYCDICSYPLATCVCSALRPTSSLVKIDIIQDSREAQCAKNTARLVKLGLPESTIWQGRYLEDFSILRDELRKEQRSVFVIYPCEESLAISDAVPCGSKKPEDVRVILLDGTWKQAYRLRRINPWLQKYSHIHVDNAHSNYKIRKAPKEHYLSTLEATAMILQHFEPAKDTLALTNLLDKMQSFYPTN